MNNKRQIKAAIFDMDGLLINSEPYWHAAELATFTEMGIDPGIKDKLPDTTGLRIDQVIKLWLQAAGISDIAPDSISEKIIAKVTAEIVAQQPLMPGVHKALTLCQQLGLKIGLASASPQALLQTVVTLFDLQNYFMVLSSAQTLPYSKPHPQVYLNAANALGVDPLHCVALEDSVNGMLAAKSARMRLIAIPAPEQTDSPVWSLADAKLPSLNSLTAEILFGG